MERVKVLKVDLHTHSIASGHALNTVYELAKAASIRKLEMLGITEHGPDMEGGPHISYFEISSRTPKKIFNVEVLMGCETNIISKEGEIDLPEDMLLRQDIIIAGLHKRTRYKSNSIEKNTKAIVGAMKNRFIHIIAHPYRLEFPVNIEKIVKDACDQNVALEINCSTLRTNRSSKKLIDRTKRMIELMLDYGGLITIGSDAHVESELGDDSPIDLCNLRSIIGDYYVNSSSNKVKEFFRKKRI